MFRHRLALDTRSPATRAAALLAAGAYAVHELRYAIAFGEDAPHMLAEHGHSYMSAVVPLIGLLLALGLGSWVAALARAHRDKVGEAEPRRLSSAWLAATASLIGIYVLQETLEGLLSPGHASAAAAVLGSGGWLAGPLALLFGAVIALLLRGARAATKYAARSEVGRAWCLIAPAPLLAVSAGVYVALRTPLLACNRAGRAPPLTS
jgi:hypothetical protein